MAVQEKKSTAHPSEETLRQFGQGRLPFEEAGVLEEHLARCENCCRFLEDSPPDSFVGGLREAVNLLRASLPANAEAFTGEVPIELTDHPRYQVLRLLGRGGMGVVYLAKHKRMGRAVALKVIHPELLSHPGALCRFEHEARAAAQLDHPNIVAAYDADQAGNLHFLVLEFVEGQNLADHLAANGPLPLSQACEAVRQGSLGLDHAHERGMVHRDIKPHNIMRMPDGRVKVLDFGLALLKEDGGWSEEKGESRKEAPPHSLPGAALSSQQSAFRLTRVGAVMGTADYIAPEQARNSRGTDGRADIYSLGCVLYHLLAGTPPFPEGTAAQKLHRHDAETPRPLNTVRPDTPEQLARVVARMMAKKPQDRYQTAAEVAAALGPFAGETLPARSRSWRNLFAVAGLVLVLFLLAAATGVVRLPVGRDREIVIETDDPNIEVIVKGDRIVRIVDPKTGQAYQLDREELTLGLVDEVDGLTVTLDGSNPVVLKRQGKRIATVRLEPTNKPTPWGKVAEKSSERPFNGKDLSTGFKPLPVSTGLPDWILEGHESRFRVEDGVLVGTSPQWQSRAYLLREGQYANYRLRFECRLEEGANCGVVVRGRLGEKSDFAQPGAIDHPVIKLTDARGHPNLPPGGSHWVASGDHYGPRPRAVPFPVGEWNAVEIEVKGISCRVWLNAVLAVTLKLDEANPSGHFLAGLAREKGRIGFQANCGTARFRHIEIQELPATE